MSIEQNLSLSNPVFRTYVLCVAALSLKMSFLAWQTVYRMISSGGYGMRNPEGKTARLRGNTYNRVLHALSF